ncbi:histidinol-phosphate transaminase [Thermocrinis jamiesonii]|jgi:histidinol-phosphate aminotransferase|uniref:histidinol-phosphate transaminase n=1 Tax=Thermocrinis jamiesonii TaxID=1302351 RepID=UPI0004964682|nr:histidinol-phosphate transaminase [Thermocrinis jamiesonii]
MIPKRIKDLSPYKTETTSCKVRLSSNELPIRFPEEVKKRIGEVVSSIPFNRYPDPYSAELKEIIALRFGVSPNNLILGNGSDELIQYLSISIGEFDRGVIYPIPTFPMYGICASVLGREKIEVPLQEDFDLNLDAFINSIREKNPAIAFFSYPNNPTGNCFSEEKIRRIREEKVFTVLDEAYYHFSGKTFLKDALSREDTVVLRTLSKIGLAGLRIGVLIAKEDIAMEINKVRLPFNITYPSQAIAKVMLAEFYFLIEEHIRMVIRERERVMKELSKLEGVKVYPSDANFFLFSTPYPADLVHKELIKEGVLVRDVSYLPGLRGCLRVSLGFPEENDAFLEALIKVLKRLC